MCGKIKSFFQRGKYYCLGRGQQVSLWKNNSAAARFRAPRYLVKPYSIALAVSVRGAAILLMAAWWIYGRPEAGKPYFCDHS